MTGAGGILDRILDTALDEFSDLHDVEQWVRLVVRLLLAALLGGVIGYERERAHKDAGLRTHMLVALGSAFFIVVPDQLGILPGELTRVIQGITAGIGFLCAGEILKSSGETRVRGLTTSASLWMTSAVGVAAGLGHSAAAIVATVVALAVLWPMRHLERRLDGARARRLPSRPHEPSHRSTA